MRPVFLLIITVLMFAGSCHKEDEILPRPPSSPPPVEEEIAEKEEPQDTIREIPKEPDVYSEIFEAAMFGDMPYRILFPKNYDSTQKYPLHIFLHGIGERGSDNEKQLHVGSSFFQADSIRKKYPSFVIFPQCPTSDYWFSNVMTRKLTSLIDTLLARYPLNRQNISIGGFSMGGYGTFTMVARNPGLFAAAVVIAGDGDQNKAPVMVKPKWRIFAGEKDDIVPSFKSEGMAVALAKAGASVSFTLYSNADHGSTWHRAFAESDYFKWLFVVNGKALAKGLTLTEAN